MTRQLHKIVTQYNTTCKADEALIDEMLLYRPQDIPRKLLTAHNILQKKLKALDEERYVAIMHDHNFYRHHYAQMYPLDIKKTA